MPQDQDVKKNLAYMSIWIFFNSRESFLTLAWGICSRENCLRNTEKIWTQTTIKTGQKSLPNLDAMEKGLRQKCKFDT